MGREVRVAKTEKKEMGPTRMHEILETLSQVVANREMPVPKLILPQIKANLRKASEAMEYLERIAMVMSQLQKRNSEL